MLQRTCDCGEHTVGGGECEGCKKKGTSLQRAADGSETPALAPSIVHQVLGSPGQSLDASVSATMGRLFARDSSRVPLRSSHSSFLQPAQLAIGPTDDHFEQEAHQLADRATQMAPFRMQTAVPRPRMVHDFSQVRVHADERAAEAARSVHAKAFTVGSNIVFGAGEYHPHSREGSWLLAHELTHVLQQQQGVLPALRLQRASFLQGVGRFIRDVVLFIPSLFGLEIPFSDDELHEYLDTVDQKDRIDGGLLSDDKARAIVKKWKAGDPGFRLDAKKKKLLILEMQDGVVTDGDRQGILDLLAGSAEEGMGAMAQIIAPGKVNINKLSEDLRKEPHASRFNSTILQSFAMQGQPLAEKVLRDIRDVKEGAFDFEDVNELYNEVFKRVRISQLLVESQHDNAFDYPENMKPTDCPDFIPPQGNLLNARVNKAARRYWTTVTLDPGIIYYFKLTEDGKNDAFSALTTLFTPQTSICDRTLIHCDYLVNVVEFRAFAESLGPDKFNDKVKNGAISMWLTYTGFPKPWVEDWRTSPKALGFQNVTPASKEDLVIGDHVTFWNHLAYDGLNVTKHQPWRLENAILVDKDASGKDQFQGHGTAKVDEHGMLEDLARAYNPFAQEALNLTRAIDDGREDLRSTLSSVFPNVKPHDGKWVVKDPGVQAARAGWTYELRKVDTAKVEDDPKLIGLRDPINPDKMGVVERPIESAKGPAPRI